MTATTTARDPRHEPQAGDVIQMIPQFNDGPAPAPLTVIEIDGGLVRWIREGIVHVTGRPNWEAYSGEMELLSALEPPTARFARGEV